MKKRALLLNVLTILCSVIVIVGLCLNFWNIAVKENILETTTNTYIKFFGDLTNFESSGLGLTINILAIIVLCGIALYIALFVMQLLKVKKVNYALLRKCIGVVLVLISIAMLVLTIVFTTANFSSNALGEVRLNGAIGLYLLIIGTLTTGLFATYPTTKK